LVIPFGLKFRLGFRQGSIQGLFFLDELSNFLGVDAVTKRHSWDISA